MEADKQAMLRRMLLSVISVIALGFAHSAKADDAIVPDIRLQKEETSGWSLRAFDFGDEDINFETFVPDRAKVETVAMRPLIAQRRSAALGSSARFSCLICRSRPPSRAII